jgi:hypothetical protein
VSHDRLLWRLGFGLLVAGILAVLVGALAGVNARHHVRSFNSRVEDLEDVVELAQDDVDKGYTALGIIGDATNQIECVDDCVEINQCVGCTRQFFTKSFLGDDVAALAPSSGEEPTSPCHRAGVASMA